VKSRDGITADALSGGASRYGAEAMQSAGTATPSRTADDVPVIAYMSAGGILFAREGNYLVRHVADHLSLPVSDAAEHFGPLMELVARPDWRPAPAPIVGYLDVYGAFWGAGEGDTALLCQGQKAGGSMYTRHWVEQSHGPLTPLAPVDVEQYPADTVPAPMAGPDPLGMFGFEGKWMECTRRSKAGPWCEWRKNTSLLSLGVLVTVAQEHAAEAHDG